MPTEQPNSCLRCGGFHEVPNSSGFCAGCEAREAQPILSAAEFWPSWILQSVALALAAASLQFRLGSSQGGIAAILLILLQSLPTGLITAWLLRRVRPKRSLILLGFQGFFALSILALAPGTRSLTIPATLTITAIVLAVLAFLAGVKWFVLLWGLVLSYGAMVASWHIVDFFGLLPQPERLSMVASHGLWTGLGHCALLGTWLDFAPLSGAKGSYRRTLTIPARTDEVGPETGDELLH